MFLLDSNVWIALFRGKSESLLSELKRHPATIGQPIGPYDLLIAAIARVNDLTLVTHNTSEFARVPGLRLADWQTPTS